MARHHHHRHHHRRNPSMGRKVLPMIGGAAVGGFLTRSLPQTFLGASNTGIMGYGANALVAIAGGWLVGKWNRDAGLGWLVGGGAAIALRVYSDYTTGASTAGASDGSMSFYANAAFPVPYATSPGSPYLSPYGAAYPAGAGAPVTVAGLPSKRLGSRFNPN